MKEKPAKGVKGFLLYSPLTKDYFFRVYNKKNLGKFKDYKLTAEDIQIELLSDCNALVEKQGKRYLDYRKRVLGK